MQYDIRPQDRPLVLAALELGDWILGQEGITEPQRDAVQALQSALFRLPDASPEIAGEYGFNVRYGDDAGSLYRAWGVSLSRAGLEIYSVYSPDPRIDLWEEMTHELDFWLRPGADNQHDGFYFGEWIDEVREPLRHQIAGADFQIQAELYEDEKVTA
jgi:hypothetical protein